MIVRPAILADAQLLFRWRLDDEQAEWWQGEGVSFTNHYQWLEERLNSPSVILLIGEVDGTPVGQARIDSNGELSFSIDKHHRGKGYGVKLVQLATEAAYQAGHTRVKAVADNTNDAGITTMMKAGYKLRPDVVFLRHPE